MGRKSIAIEEINNIEEAQPEVKKPPLLTQAIMNQSKQEVYIPPQFLNINPDSYREKRKNQKRVNTGLLMAVMNSEEDVLPDGQETSWGAHDEKIFEGDQPTPMKQKEETKE